MGSEVTMDHLPLCDFHKEQGSEVPARYDAKTIYGPWAYLCQKCFELYGPSQLGTGYGQRLVTQEEGNDGN